MSLTSTQPADRPNSAWRNAVSLRKEVWKPSLWIGVFLLAGIAAVYWPVLRHQFIYCDDPDYVYDNLNVKSGITWAGIHWAFTTGYANNWHPLTWLSHMLDWQLYGGRPGLHHLTSVILHAVNTLLLFAFLRRITRELWQSAFVAALFALHPLHVESVAWVSERKDVLSTFFFMLTLLAYAAYAKSIQYTVSSVQSSKKTTATRSALSAPRSTAFYALALFLFACGLMSKPMLVTLPFVLLLLDFWPLGRMRIFTAEYAEKSSQSKLVAPKSGEGESNIQRPGSEIKHPVSSPRLLLEKLPFLALAAASCVITVLVQRQNGNMSSMEGLPLDLRVCNALVSYLRYILKMFWPTRLAAYYPYSKSIPIELIALAAFVVIGLCSLAVFQFKKRPWIMFGWLWFLITLLPVIGLVQVGSQSMADRYTYIPLIGLFIILAWAAADLTTRFRFRAAVVSTGGLVSVLGCLILSSAQVRLWRDTETLYRHTLSITTGNAHAHLNLGAALLAKENFQEASQHFAEALRIDPDYPEAQSNLGFTLAIQNRLDEAIELYQTAIARKPATPKLHYLLGNAFNAQGKKLEAIAEYRKELEVNPGHPLALNDLAWILATDPDPSVRDGRQAVELAERACKVSDFQVPQLIGTLAAAYAEAGRFDEAIATAEKAKSQAIKNNDPDIARRNEELQALYKTGKPFRNK